MSHASANRADSYEAGLELAKCGRHYDAIVCFETALASRPDDARILFALGNTAEAIGHNQAAETFFRRVLDQDPDRLEALVNLANFLRARGRTDETIALLKPAIERNPHHAELWMTLGSGLRETGDAKTAEIFYRESLRLSPDYAAALGNLADLLADKGAVAEARALYARVIAAEPSNAQAHLNRAILLLLMGDLENGWRDYEYRLAIKKREVIADHGLPRWDGAISPGLRLLITAEQGLGDQVMFASLLPDLAEAISRAGGRVTLEAESRLVPLFANSFAGVSVHESKIEQRGGIKLAHYGWLGELDVADAAIELASLPRFLRRRVADFPMRKAYLKPDSAERSRWSQWLRSSGNGPYIGLCWRSGQMGGLRNLQYAPFENWGAFVRELKGTPVSLQYDARPDEIAALGALSARDILVPPYLDQKMEIDRTAAMMSALDATVSAPTSVAWIAAAIGVPTFKLLYNNAWTSFGANYEPFAPQCRLIIPKTCGDWSDTFAQASIALSAHSGNPGWQPE